MNEIRLDAFRAQGVREEILAPFPGDDDLRRQIVEARDRGDDGEAHRLEREHRDRRLAVRRNIAILPTSESPISTRTTAPPVNGSRELSAYVATWNCLHRVALKGTGEPCFVRASRHCFDQWLRSLDLIDTPVPLMVDHKLGPVGTWVAFAVDAVGLRGLALVDETPAGDLILDAADGGGLFFSCHWEPVDSREVARLRGLPVFELIATVITEASATTHPADADCRVISVRGRQPDYHRIEAAIERDTRLKAQRSDLIRGVGGFA